MPLDLATIPGISFVYRVTTDVYGFLSSRFKRIPPAERVEKRERTREMIEAGLKWNSGSNSYGEGVIRDVARVDEYPDGKDRGRMSPWFRCGLLGTYHRGLEIALRYEGLVYDESHGGWRLYSHEVEEPQVRAVLVGWIPFDYIVSVNWDGDRFFGVPHVYCKYANGRTPYEDVFFARTGQNPGGRPFYVKLASENDVTRLSKKLKTGYYRKTPR